MSLFHEIPWEMLDNNVAVAGHAVLEAQKRVGEGRLAIAVLGGPGLFKPSKGGIWLQEQGVEVLQVAGDEVDEQIEIWVGVFNAYIQGHTRLYYLSRADKKSLSDLLHEAYSIKDE